jgi:hypothetical protein
MSQGKYSPSCPHANKGYDFKYNCYKQIAAPWTHEIAASGVVYDEKTMFGNYDEEGFDRYGYSAFDADGNYAGIGSGIDRLGYTENDYLCMSEEDFAWM